MLVQSPVQRSVAPNTFHPVGGTIDDPARLRAARTSLRAGQAVLRIDMLADPQAPTRGPVRATLSREAVNRIEGACT